MSKMIAELTNSLEHLNKKAQRAQEKAQAALAAAEDAHAAAEEAQYLLRAATLMENKLKSDILGHSVTLESDDPVLSWTSQSIEIDAEIEVGDREVTAVVTLSDYTVDLNTRDLDALEPDSAEVEFSVQHLVQSISETIMDHSSSDDQKEAAIAAITSELRARLLD